MTHSAKIIADSVSPDGVRLTTMEVTFPRIVLAEFNTHRMFSRNSASSRAIPIGQMLRMVDDDPYIPTHWGKNQKGMQADEELDERLQAEARREWMKARADAIFNAQKLHTIGVHKQITNRLLEPFMWHTCIVTATEWDNFFHLRCHPAAHPEIRLAAEKMREAMGASEPAKLGYGDWHLPYIPDDEEERKLEPWVDELIDQLSVHETSEREYWDKLRKVSVGRCARVSYLTHDGVRDPSEDVALHDRLLASGHMSPFEHVARPMTIDDVPNEVKLGLAQVNEVIPIARQDVIKNTFKGNFRGWVQYRKTIPHEHDVMGERS